MEPSILRKSRISYALFQNNQHQISSISLSRPSRLASRHDRSVTLPIPLSTSSTMTAPKSRLPRLSARGKPALTLLFDRYRRSIACSQCDQKGTLTENGTSNDTRKVPIFRCNSCNSSIHYQRVIERLLALKGTLNRASQPPANSDAPTEEENTST